MKTHKTPKGELVMYSVNEYADDIYEDMGTEKIGHPQKTGRYKSKKYGRRIKLLGTLSEITEEEAKKLVEKVNIYNRTSGYGERDYRYLEESLEQSFYMNYNPVHPPTATGKFTAKSSLRSLIESKGLDPEKTLLILRKEK